MVKNKIIVGKTKNKATVSVCVNCKSYNIPHFNYDKGKKHYSIEFERAVPVDHSRLMDLKERTDLEMFFASQNMEHQMTNWKLAVKLWNKNNKIKISNNLHKPYYRNMVEEIDNYTISTWSNRSDLIEGVQIYCDEDIELAPHFHIKLPDKSDVALYFDRAEYLQPLQRPLTDKEIEMLIRYLKQKCHIEYYDNYTNWEYLIYAWNNQNCTTNNFIFPEKEQLNSNLKMPDYRNLNKEQ